MKVEFTKHDKWPQTVGEVKPGQMFRISKDWYLRLASRQEDQDGYALCALVVDSSNWYQSLPYVFEDIGNDNRVDEVRECHILVH